MLQESATLLVNWWLVRRQRTKGLRFETYWKLIFFLLLHWLNIIGKPATSEEWPELEIWKPLDPHWIWSKIILGRLKYRYIERFFLKQVNCFHFTVYVDMGMLSTDTATLAFTFGTTASTARTWEIKVSQIPCYSFTRFTLLHTSITVLFLWRKFPASKPDYSVLCLISSEKVKRTIAEKLAG